MKCTYSDMKRADLIHLLMVLWIPSAWSYANTCPAADQDPTAYFEALDELHDRSLANQKLMECYYRNLSQMPFQIAVMYIDEIFHSSPLEIVISPGGVLSRVVQYGSAEWNAAIEMMHAYVSLFLAPLGPLECINRLISFTNALLDEIVIDAYPLCLPFDLLLTKSIEEFTVLMNQVLVISGNKDLRDDRTKVSPYDVRLQYFDTVVVDYFSAKSHEEGFQIAEAPFEALRALVTNHANNPFDDVFTIFKINTVNLNRNRVRRGGVF